MKACPIYALEGFLTKIRCSQRQILENSESLRYALENLLILPRGS
jgi:hypothetical protein